MIYGRIVNHRYVGNPKGDRLANLLERRVAEANEKKRPGLKMHALGLVKAVDVLREVSNWTACSALIDFYGFSEEEFTAFEYAAGRVAS